MGNACALAVNKEANTLVRSNEFEKRQSRSFNPGRLRELRIANGLTPERLGEMADLGGTRITELEHGYGPLLPSERAALASALQVDSDTLGQAIPERPELTGIPFVCTAQPPSRITLEESEIWLRYLAQLYGVVSKPFASMNGQQMYFALLQNKLEYAFDAGDPNYLDLAGVETFAARLRDLLVIAQDIPVAGVLAHLESAGALIGRAPLANKQYAAAAWINGRAVVVLNSQLRAVQNRFVALWAMFHLMLHRSVSAYDMDNSARFEHFSQQARNAALAFLMPANSFSPELRQTMATGDWRGLCRRWGVTERNILQRANMLNAWSPELAAMLEAERLAVDPKSMPVSEADYPVYLKKIVMKSNEQLQVTPQDLADRANLTVAQVVALASITHTSETTSIRPDNVVVLRRA